VARPLVLVDLGQSLHQVLARHLHRWIGKHKIIVSKNQLSIINHKNMSFLGNKYLFSMFILQLLRITIK
jgi:hypothetical protein